MRHSTSAPLALLDRDPGFYRCIGDIPTYALSVLAMHLHAQDQLHHRGLRKAAAGLFSAGRASAVLARMQRAGLIEPLDPFESGRHRRYGPQPAMVEALRAAYLIELTSLSMIEPRVVDIVARWDDPAVFNRIISFLATMHLAGPTLDKDLVEPLAGVGRRSMGLFLAYALAEAAFNAGLPRAEGTIDINRSDVSRRLGVSRTHSRRIMTLLKTAGLIADTQTADRLTLTPAFAVAYEIYFAGMFSMLMAAIIPPEQ